MNNIDEAKRVIDIEINALIELKDSIGQDFEEILYLITNCKGKVILCGMGKSGHVAKKISATLASLGTPSFFLHPAEAQHGDMGMVSADDVVTVEVKPSREDTPFTVSADGQNNFTLTGQNVVQIRRADVCTTIIKTKPQSFYDVLRHKLK